MNFELRHVRCFIRLAEDLHFSRAAAGLNMTQPGLSRTISELEREVGTPLLERTTRTVRLTEAGRAFLADSRGSLEQLGLAVTKARRVAAGLSGELRVAYMDFAINGRLPELVRLFGLRHPEIRLELSYMPTTRQKAALLDRRIDVGFMIGAFDNALMTSYPLDEDHYVALLPATHRLANVASLTLGDLARSLSCSAAARTGRPSAKGSSSSAARAASSPASCRRPPAARESSASWRPGPA
jgi:DNA-binding transcriptional LysR family regulator